MLKSIKKILLLVICLFIFCSCGNSNLKDINYSEFNKMKDNKETFFIVIYKDGCPYCEMFIPKVEEILDEYKITGYKINISNMSEDDYKEFESEFNFDGTPTTIFITDGNELSVMQRIDGNVSKEKIITKLKNNNYIE